MPEVPIAKVQTLPKGTYKCKLDRIDPRPVHLETGEDLTYLNYMFKTEDGKEIEYSCNKYLSMNSKHGWLCKKFGYDLTKLDKVNTDEQIGKLFNVDITIEEVTTKKTGDRIEVNRVVDVVPLKEEGKGQSGSLGG